MDAKLQQISYDGDIEEFFRYLKNNESILDRLAITPLLRNNPLHIAASRGNAELVKEVVRRKTELAKEFNEDGYTALHLAAAQGSLEVVKELLAFVGSSLCIVQDKDGMLPIHHAAQKGKLAVLQHLFLVDKESARRRTCLSDTILHLAVKSNCVEVLKFLIDEMDVDTEFLNAQNARGNTILHLAVARKQLQTVEFLVNKQGINVNAVNLNFFTPLDVLMESPSQTGDEDIKAVLLEVGGIMTFSDSTLLPVPKMISFASDDTHSAQKTCAHCKDHSTYKKTTSMISNLLSDGLLCLQRRAAPSMRILQASGKHETSTRNVDSVMNVILISVTTYLTIFFLPKIYDETFKSKFSMIFAAITLGSIILFIFCMTRPRTTKTTVLSIFLGSLIAILQILPENNRAKLIIFITAHFQLALCLQQLKKIERTERQANLLSTNKRAFKFAQTVTFVTVFFMSFSAAIYCGFIVYRTILSFEKSSEKAMKLNVVVGMIDK